MTILFFLLVTITEARNECPAILKAAGLSDSFASNVAHRLHSLTVEDIRYYFKEDVSEENDIPTVNLDLSPNAQRVLPNAPLSGYDTSFATIAMRHLDQVLSHMDQTDYSITNYSILEKLVHVMHMAELWSRAQEHYEMLTVYPPSTRACACVTDTDSNGLMDQLQLLALKIKFPGLTSGVPAAPPASKENSAYRIAGGYDLSFLRPGARRFKRKLAGFDFEGDDEDVVERAREQLTDGDEGLDKRLDGEEGWEAWREGFKAMGDEGNFQFAMFIYCKLN